MQFSQGENVDDLTGDPFMMMIAPVEQYLSNYVFNVVPEFSINYVTIYATPDNFEHQNIFIDDFSLGNRNSWVAVYCSQTEICGYITYWPLQPGHHTLYHTSNFSSYVGMSAYGFDDRNSYGHPGGLKFNQVECKVFVNSDIHSCVIFWYYTAVKTKSLGSIVVC